MKTLKTLLFAAIVIFTASCGNCDCMPPPEPLDSANTQILLVQVDYTTNTLVSGKTLYFESFAPNFTVAADYKSPGDFGYIKLFYSEINEMIFYGDIIWMGCGGIHFPTEWTPAVNFSGVPTDDLRFPQNGFDTIYNNENQEFGFPEEGFNAAWCQAQSLQIVRNYLQANPEEKVKVYFYMPSVGVGDPADWKWIFILRKTNENQPQTCEYENPLTDLAWLAEIYDNLSVGNSQFTSISQVNYSGGVGFFVNYGMALDDCGIFYDCAGNKVCHTCMMENTCNNLNIDWQNSITLWQGGDFCDILNGQSIAQASFLINQFFQQQALTTRPANELFTDEQKIEEFVAWLNGFDCITNAETVCVSCVYTNPPKSEISITYTHFGQTSTYIVDILMTDIPQFAGVHTE
ncbi:MAG: hypothetical protein LBN95_12570 [Prevotellaceae bacterium]|nr:hypothetical protein [Prevotellaceae bacterium]